MSTTSSTAILEIHPPAPLLGQAVYTITEESKGIKFLFNTEDAGFTEKGQDLIITLDSGFEIVLENYLPMAQKGSIEYFEMQDGQLVAGTSYMYAYKEDLYAQTETAAGFEGEEEFFIDASLLSPGESGNILVLEDFVLGKSLLSFTDMPEISFAPEPNNPAYTTLLINDGDTGESLNLILQSVPQIEFEHFVDKIGSDWQDELITQPPSLGE